MLYVCTDPRRYHLSAYWWFHWWQINTGYDDGLVLMRHQVKADQYLCGHTKSLVFSQRPQCPVCVTMMGSKMVCHRGTVLLNCLPQINPFKVEYISGSIWWLFILMPTWLLLCRDVKQTPGLTFINPDQLDQGSTDNHSPVNSFAPTVTKFCVGGTTTTTTTTTTTHTHDTKSGNCRDKIVDSRAFPSWSLIHGSSWSGLIKVEPGYQPSQHADLTLIIGNTAKHDMWLAVNDIYFNECSDTPMILTSRCITREDHWWCVTR